MKTIEDYRADMLTILGDSAGRRYSENMLDAGIREALGPYRAFFPNKNSIIMRVTEIDGISVALSGLLPPDADILTARIEAGLWLEYSVYRTDQKLYLNLQPNSPVPAVGDNLKMEVSAPHCIKGLNNATMTTVPDPHEFVICKGASGYAMRIRARSVTEVFGKRPEDRAALMEQADSLVTEYFSDLSQLQPSVYDPLPRGGFEI